MKKACKRHCGQTVYPSLSQVGLYWEYTKRSVGSHDYYVDGFNYISDNYNETAIFNDYILPNFGPRAGKKNGGGRFILWIAIPVVLNSLMVLYLTLSCLCRCLCGSGKKQEPKVAAEYAASKKNDDAVVKKSDDDAKSASSSKTQASKTSEPAKAKSPAKSGGKKKGQREKLE